MQEHLRFAYHPSHGAHHASLPLLTLTPTCLPPGGIMEQVHIHTAWWQLQEQHSTQHQASNHGASGCYWCALDVERPVS